MSVEVQNDARAFDGNGSEKSELVGGSGIVGTDDFGWVKGDIFLQGVYTGGTNA